jgi:molybdopterin-guanine dinucleotide biosynthesis protein A
LLVLSVDVWAMEESPLRWLWEQRKAAAPSWLTLWPRFPQRPQGEPLVALYRPEIAPMLEDAWGRGESSPSRAIGVAHRYEPFIPESWWLSFVNVNDAEEWRMVEACWKGGGMDPQAIHRLLSCRRKGLRGGHE